MSEADVLLRNGGIECWDLFGFGWSEGEFETAAIVSHDGKTVIRGDDERTAYWFVGYGVYDYAADAIRESGLRCALGR
jgi:hypothetical protein